MVPQVHGSSERFEGTVGFMNRDQHVTIGLLFFALYVILLNHLKPLQLDAIIYGGIAAAIFSVVPDMLEPPTSGRHRRFAHSKRVLRNSFLAFLALTVIVFLFPYAIIIGGALLGYVMHLAADSTTPAGLPD